jgi:hypothetical protein
MKSTKKYHTYKKRNTYLILTCFILTQQQHIKYNIGQLQSIRFQTLQFLVVKIKICFKITTTTMMMMMMIPI